FVIVATGKGALAPIERADDARLAVIRGALAEVATELAQAIIRDGEGATKFITISVEGGRDAAECRKIALGIAHSPLVKTAFFASDPNLGRIICAIGNAAAPDLDPSRVSFRLDDVPVVDAGGRAPSYREEDGQRVMKQDEISVTVALGRGGASSRVWTYMLTGRHTTRLDADYNETNSRQRRPHDATPTKRLSLQLVNSAATISLQRQADAAIAPETLHSAPLGTIRDKQTITPMLWF